MTQQEINESNRLIANFMGVKLCKKHPDKQCFLRIRNNKNPSIQYWHLLKYHSDWSWLMPVVEKLYKMDETDVKGYDTFNDDYLDDTRESFFDINISGTYETVVNAIKWFNKNK